MPMGAPSLLGQRQVRQAQVCPGSPDSAEGPISPGAVEGRWGGGWPCRRGSTGGPRGCGEAGPWGHGQAGSVRLQRIHAGRCKIN